PLLVCTSSSCFPYRSLSPPRPTLFPYTTLFRSKVDANQVYAKLCAGCHGADAHGTQQGPGLSGNLRLRRRSASRLRSLIRNGIPDRKSTRLNSSHLGISYAVFCLKKKQQL